MKRIRLHVGRIVISCCAWLVLSYTVDAGDDYAFASVKRIQVERALERVQDVLSANPGTTIAEVVAFAFCNWGLEPIASLRCWYSDVMRLYPREATDKITAMMISTLEKSESGEGTADKGVVTASFDPARLEIGVTLLSMLETTDVTVAERVGVVMDKMKTRLRRLSDGEQSSPRRSIDRFFLETYIDDTSAILARLMGGRVPDRAMWLEALARGTATESSRAARVFLLARDAGTDVREALVSRLKKAREEVPAKYIEMKHDWLFLSGQFEPNPDLRRAAQAVAVSAPEGYCNSFAVIACVVAFVQGGGIPHLEQACRMLESAYFVHDNDECARVLPFVFDWKSIVGPLSLTLDSKDEDVRCGACKLLGYGGVRSRDAREAVMERLAKDQSARVRARAAEAMATMGEAQDVQALAARAEIETDETSKAEILAAIDVIKSPLVVPTTDSVRN